MNKTIKLLLVDDSSLVRKILKSIFKDDTAIEVVGEAEDGQIAMEMIKKNHYDMILLDYEMPNMNGLELLRALKKDNSLSHKPSVLVFSSLTNKGSKQTVECLLAGAQDYIPKPSRSLGGAGTLDEIKKTLREKIISIVSSQQQAKTSPATTSTSSTSPSTGKAAASNKKLRDPGLLVIGCSTGGPAALEVVFKSLPKNFPFPILIVQHMPESFTAILAQTLTNNGNIPVQEVTETTTIEKGKAYLAKGGKHMRMKDSHTLELFDGPPVNFCIPAVDVLFESVAKVYKRSVISVVLTGMGKDGREGVRMLKDKLDCYSIAQDQKSSVVWAMPKVVFEAGLADACLDLKQIGDHISNVGCFSPTR